MHVTTLELPTISLRPSVLPARMRLLYALFFFSGFPALIYQLTWQRSLFRIFGVNTESVTIVVTAFMLGLGLGSLAGGWITRRRKLDALLLLGVIELSTAAFGVASLELFDLVGRLVLNWPLPAVAAINLLLVLVPTVLMGATLPILISYVVRMSGQIGSAVGTLYYVNTLGASVACLACAAAIFPFLGTHAAVWIAAAINVVVGGGAILARSIRWNEVEGPFSSENAIKQPILGLPFVAALAALGGFVSLSYEIFLFRTISFASGSSSIAFALTLCGFLAGIAGGAYRAGKACEELLPVGAMRKAVSELMWANLFGALFLPLLTQSAWIGGGVIGVAIAMVYLIARQWGALLPYLSQLGIAADERAGMRAALLYFSNIVGCAVGAVLTGFVLTDYLGLVQISVLLLTVGSVCTLLLVAKLDVAIGERLRRAAFAVLILVVGGAFLPLLADRVFENLQNDRISDHAFAHVVENRSGVITVDTNGVVFGNGMYDGRFSTDLKTDLNGIIRPYALSLFHAAPRDVLMIGLSSGSWAQVIANNPDVTSLTVVEINRGYLELIAQQPEVQSILHNPKVKIVTDDGRRWLNRHPERRFDAVVSNTTWHFRANVTNLLSAEFLQLVKQHLNPGGIFFYNTTYSRRVQRTGCLMFPFGARFTNHMVVSETAIDWNYPRWRKVLENYSIDGRSEFNLANADDRVRLDAVVRDYGRESPMIEDCPTLLRQTANKDPITDDNMGTEWRYYLNSE
jgi:spermidine synthase